MTDKLDDAELCELTRAHPSIAIAECIDGLGCTVHAGGREIVAPWICYKVMDLVGMHILNGALITSRTHAAYFVLKYDREREEFQVLHGPVTADGLRAELTRRCDAARG